MDHLLHVHSAAPVVMQCFVDSSAVHHQKRDLFIYTKGTSMVHMYMYNCTIKRLRQGINCNISPANEARRKRNFHF